jgi:Arc/MetJ-type ribon-helix-helix transcriptional regulator
MMREVEAKKEKLRVQLELSEKMRELIDRLVVETEASSRAEVIRRALSIYAIVLDEAAAGKRVEVVDTQTKERERLILP